MVKAAGVWVLVTAFVVGYFHVFAPEGAMWFAAGVCAATFLWLMSRALDAADGTALRRLGGDAERWVSDDLRRLRKSGWVVIDHVPFNDQDVDHFIVGPGGAWAIETKRSSIEVSIDEGSIHGVYGGDPCFQARRGARHMRGLLHSIGLDVRPAVVLAGPGAPDLGSDGALVRGEHGDVLVLTLRGLSQQLPVLSFTTLTGPEIDQARSLVADFVERRDRYERTST